jgi:HlyD family secretion protein
VARSGDLTPSAPSLRSVWVLRGGKPVRVEVRTGITDGTFTEVIGGPLEAGDRVITDSLEEHSEGGRGRMPMRRIF